MMQEVYKKTGQPQFEAAPTLRNYVLQCARQHTVTYFIGSDQNNFN